MTAVHAYEETQSIAHLTAVDASGVLEFVSEIEYLRELAEGEMTVQTIFQIKQALRRLGAKSTALRPEVIVTP